MAPHPEHAAGETPVPADDPDRRAETRALVSQAPTGRLASLAVALLVAWGLPPAIAGWQAGAWFAAVATVTFARAADLRRLGSGAPSLLPDRVVRRHLAWTVASGSLWAVLPWLVAGAALSERMFLVALAILGLTAGAAVAYAPSRLQFEAFAVPPVLSLALRLLLAGHATATVAGLLCLVYLGAMIWLAHVRREDAVAVAAMELVHESRRRTERELARQRQRLELLIDSIPALVSYVTPERTYGYVNSQYERYFNRSRKSFVGVSIASLAGDATYERLRPHLDRALAGEEQWFEFSPEFPDGRRPTFSVHYVPDWSPAGRVRGCFALLHEVTGYKATESRLLEEIRTDYLTGLLNRHGFLVAVAEVVADQRKRPALDFVCYLDLDRFKEVNDRAGHDAGDAVLRQAASRMAEDLRKSDVLARIGGDEFGLFLPGCTVDEARTRLSLLGDRVAASPFDVGEQRFRLGISIGAVAVDRARHSVEDLLREADAACYTAKRLPGASPVFAPLPAGPDAGTGGEPEGTA